MDNNSKQLIDSLKNAVVKAVNPSKIILFGSYAKGNQTVSSDIDLLVIEDEGFSRTRQRRKEAAKIWQALL